MRRVMSGMSGMSRGLTPKGNICLIHSIEEKTAFSLTSLTENYIILSMIKGFNHKGVVKVL